MNHARYWILTALIVLITLACSVQVDTGLQKPSPTTPPPVIPPAEKPTEPPQAESPTEPPPPPPPPPTPDNLTHISFEGASFSFDKSLAGSAWAEKLPATPPSEDMPSWEISPETLHFVLENYLLADTFHKPQLYIYPVSEYASMDANAGNKISSLQSILINKPQLTEDIPFLPMWNAAQMMQAQIKYFDFKNGSGVRFLSQYGQAAAPINNNSLFYTFQGLTKDNRFYVSVILPVSHPMLPATYTDLPPGQDYETFANNFSNYIADIEAQLNAQPPESFKPNLQLLDDLAQSILIEWNR
ncbi:MAG: hypothetical protein HPY45_01065 [Anaerolineae bacterium]|nr:hypothetical protein [Anaerolineae bacterium]